MNDASPNPLTPAAWLFLTTHRVGHLATVDAAGRPTVVPFCYATDGQVIYSALDDKPKRVQPAALARVRNLRAHPEVALVVDDYAEDWSRLAYLLVHGRADVLESGAAPHVEAVALLRAKYPQYTAMPIEERAVIRIQPLRSSFWTAAPPPPETG